LELLRKGHARSQIARIMVDGLTPETARRIEQGLIEIFAPPFNAVHNPHRFRTESICNPPEFMSDPPWQAAI
jgi:hypothetical protein